MHIQSTSIYQYPTASNIKNNPSKIIQNVHFKGHTQVEKYAKKGIRKLIQQTAIGRGQRTNEQVKEYVRANFGEDDVINIVSAGCSTGEEAVTQSMMYYDMRDKVKILGIDLGKKAIKQAQSRKYIFEVPHKNYNFQDYFVSAEAVPFTDTYLVRGERKGLSAQQQYLLTMFNEFFEPTNRKIKTPFWERLHNQMERRMGIEPLEIDRIEYRLKDGKAENCKFVCGDVTDINKITNGEKSNVIFFKNALYHMTTKDIAAFDRTLRGNAKEIVKNLMSEFKDNLKNKGLVVFGEKENYQMADYDIVPEVMTNLGFKPLNKLETGYPNIWKKD